MNDTATIQALLNKVPQQTFGTTVVSFHPPAIRELVLELMHYHKDLVARIKLERLSDPIPDQENIINVMKQLCTEFNIVLEGLYDHIDILILAEQITEKLRDRRMPRIQIGATDV